MQHHNGSFSTTILIIIHTVACVFLCTHSVMVASLTSTQQCYKYSAMAPTLPLLVLQVTKDKDAAVRGQDFEKAGQLRDREMELKAKISAIIAGAKETSKAEAESVEGGGPQVRDGGCCVSCSLVYPCGLY